ncbi:MAG: sigma-70 family RNA polymerase sigma factor, partial [Candidatus Poribacteria bacterium]|nr:sigma-70 family RNA polymerase sigma factor [Candidatus Poribacteria bacterium]
DVQLIQRTLSGDDTAFGILLQRHQKSVHALVWRKIGDFHTAEDITQDTFLQAYKKLSTLKNHNQFAGWLYVIADRLCIDWSRKRRLITQSLEDTPVEEIERTSYTHHVSEARETECTERRRELVKKLLAKLPESERTVVTLYYLGEMTTREIGKFLGVSVDTIKSRLRRGRKRLQEDEELMIQEVFGGVQIPASLGENVMRQVADMVPTPSPAAKPFLPWVALGTVAVLVALMLGASNQYLVRFQKPYSFEAQSEPTIEIVDSPILLDIAAEPAMRNQVGRDTSPSETSRAGTQVSNVTSVSVTQENAAKQWMPRTNMPTARFQFGTCVVDGKVFAIGGEVDKFGDTSIATVEMYDPKTDTWERKADMPTARAGMSTLVVDGKIYAIGGGQGKKHRLRRGWGHSGKLLPTIEMYDPVTDTWTQKADMPVPRSSNSTCIMDGKIYIIGGVAANRKQWRLDNVDIYDPATDTWTQAKSMNHARGGASVSVVNGKIYVMGGVGWPQIPNHPGPFLSSVEVFNPETNHWKEVAEMPTPKGFHTASVIDGKIYVIGGGFRGDDQFKYLSTVEVYDPETDRWTQEPDMPIGKWGHRAEVINENIYIFGGSSAVFRPLTMIEVYGIGEVSQSVDPTGKLVQTWETTKNSNH